MTWRVQRVAAILGFLPALAVANSGIIQVTNIRSWSHPGSTRVILEMTGPFEFKTDRAHNPDRLYFDVLNARPLIAHRRVATHEVRDSLVSQVRIAETAPGTTRVVFDLVSAASYKVTRLDAPDRMVIELRPMGAPPRTQEAPVTTRTRRPFVYPPPPRPATISILTPPPLTILAELAVVRIPDPMALIAVRPPRQQTKQTTAPPVMTKVLTASPKTATSASLPSENATRSLTRALGLKINRIVIDAGHGGHDDGTIGPNGVLEKEVVLDVALRLSKLVQEKMGVDVVLTRSDDNFIPLHERTAIANQYKADLFLSIHANSSPSPEVAGTETFFLNFTNVPGAIDVAARENAEADKSVGELKDLIQSITLNDKIEESHTFAQTIQTSLQSQAARSNPAARNRGVKRAPFVVLIGASMPSVLAEIGFLSNSKDEANLRKPEYRQRIAEALYKGLGQYTQSLSHYEVARQVSKPDKQAGIGISQ